MNRTPEHEQLITELTERSGLRREVVEQATDVVIRHLMNALIEKTVERMEKDFLVARHLGLADGDAALEQVVPKRRSSRVRRMARAIRTQRGARNG